MQHDEQIRVIEGLMTHLDNDTNVDAGRQVKNPVSVYTDPARAVEEWQTFFQSYPHVIGLSDDLPEPGTFFTNADLGKPILCIRDKDGQFRAFYNVCRHRGSVLETAARGHKRLFTCPFHAWSYSSSGDLVAVPKEHHFGEIDRSCHGLVPLPCVERYGILWVHPDKNGQIDLDDLLGDQLSEELASWDLGTCARRGETMFPHDCNWKLAIDTYGETYHFEALHKDTLNYNFYGNTQLYDTYKRNHRMALCIRPIDAMRTRPKESWHVLQGALPVYYLFPNIQLLFGADGPTLVRIYPDAVNPNKSRSEIGWYSYPDSVRERVGPVFAEYMTQMSLDERIQAFAAVIEAEDYVAAASNHVGALSGAQDHVLFGRNEPALHHYHNAYNEALGLAPLEWV